MKKPLIAVASLFVIVALGMNVYAQTELTEKTATDSPDVASKSASALEPEVQDLKDKIATKVAELRSASQKAVAGTIISIEDDVIMISSSDGNDYEINVDESLTETFQVTTGFKEINSGELEVGDYIIVTGPRLDKTVDASVIYRDTEYIVLSGKVTEADDTDFIVRVTTTSKENYTIDIEKNTTQRLLNIKTFETEKIGFSKIKEGDTIHFAAQKDPDTAEVNRVSGVRILIIPQEYFQK